MIKGIAHVCVSALDLAAVERFYCSGLGMEKVFDFLRGGDPIGFYLKMAEAAYIEVFVQDKIDLEAKCPIKHLCLQVDDIDAVARGLVDCGYPATEKVLGADQSWQVWTTDPSGVRIEFHQYTAESSQLTGKDCVLD